MSIITLTSDRKVEDFFLGRVKGQIMKDCPGAVIIDITHGIEPFNVTKTGFILKHSYKHFPEKTIHLIGVDSEKSSTQEHLLAEYENQYFICSDNGILGLIFETKPNKVVKINHYGQNTHIMLDNIIDIERPLHGGPVAYCRLY